MDETHRDKDLLVTCFSSRGSDLLPFLSEQRGTMPVNRATKFASQLIVAMMRYANPFFNMFNAAKDTMTSRAAQYYVNNQIVRYGEVQNLKIDSRRKTVEVSCLLHGEHSPITIKVENYTVETDGGKKFFQATDISCTRPWLQNLLADFARNRRVELPGWAEGVL